MDKNHPTVTRDWSVVEDRGLVWIEDMDGDILVFDTEAVPELIANLQELVSERRRADRRDHVRGERGQVPSVRPCVAVDAFGRKYRRSRKTAQQALPDGLARDC